MKKRIVTGLLVPMLLVMGLALSSAAPASAEATDTYFRCGYGFCYSAYDDQGWRVLALNINPGNNNDMCIRVFTWDSGTPTLKRSAGPMPARTLTGVDAVWYGVHQDATIHATSCSTGVIYFTFKVSSWNNPNGFI